MKKEIEAKILEIDPRRVTSDLERIGAVPSFEGTIKAYSFDYSDEKIRKEGSRLRLREKNSIVSVETIVELTYKKPVSKNGVKIVDEYEIKVDSLEETKRILELLGLVQYKSEEKLRISYKLPDASFEIDTFPNIPPFLEIEANSVELVKAYALKLGFKEEDLKPWSGNEVIRYYERLRKKS